MISQHLDRFLHSNCRNIFLSLGHNVQRQAPIFYHYEEHHKDVQYFYVLTPSVNRFPVKLMKEHPGKKYIIL